MVRMRDLKYLGVFVRELKRDHYSFKYLTKKIIVNSLSCLQWCQLWRTEKTDTKSLKVECYKVITN